ncbi:MAG: hypothetical protein IKJ74_03270 [Clostridia bacterium]|nr:hypothetical protein [Clostridia bacterium]
MKRDYVCVNDFAPRDGRLSVYFKKMVKKKSDGFAAVFDGQVYLIDGGLAVDLEMLQYLIQLREKWLSFAPETVDRKSARLEVHVIVSHPHPDHMGILPQIFSDPRFCVQELFAPTRSYRSKPGPNQLGKLTEYEDKLEALLPLLEEYHHVARDVIRIPFGTKHPICPSEGDVLLDLYTAPFDWSEDRESEDEGFGYLQRSSNPHNPHYAANPEQGWINGALNGNSLWVKFRKGKQTVLITGDQRATDQMLGAMIRYHGEEEFCCDVLKLTHHGEKNYPVDLIRAAAPSVTVFTVTRERSTPETVELCQKVSTPYYLGDGNLLVTLNGESIEVKQYE